MVKGVYEFRRRMVGVRAAVERELRAELEIVADQIVADMRLLVPVDDGDLRDSIGWTWGKLPGGTGPIGVVSQAKKDRLRITIYAAGGDQYYGRFIEHGTKDRPAHPFFFPAWRANRRRVRSRLSRRLTRTLKAV